MGTFGEPGDVLSTTRERIRSVLAENEVAVARVREEAETEARAHWERSVQSARGALQVRRGEMLSARRELRERSEAVERSLRDLATRLAAAGQRLGQQSATQVTAEWQVVPTWQAATGGQQNSEGAQGTTAAEEAQQGIFRRLFHSVTDKRP